jgi:hypothetical protein
MDKMKSIGVLAGGLGLLILAIAYLISVISPHTEKQPTPKEAIAELNQMMNSPEYQEMIRKNMADLEDMKIEVETKIIR